MRGQVSVPKTIAWPSQQAGARLTLNYRRAAMTFEQWAEHRRIHGDWPEPIQGSVISAL